jgi:hypothetical protein
MIPVIWHSEKEGRGRYNVTSMLNEMFDLYECRHIPGLNLSPQIRQELNGAVFVVHGGREPGRLDFLNRDIENLKWVILIFLGDEEASFPAELVEHPNKKVWVQEPMSGKHDFADRFMVDGYPHDCQRHLVECEKDLDWVFAGQVTHERRIACVDALRRIEWGGIVVETKGFCQGVSRAEYYHLLCRAKIVPCPSGPFSPDACRPWEALEAGAIPILDDLSPQRREPGFWRYALGEHPLPVVTDWSTLPGVIEELKLDWPERNELCQYWWMEHKSNFFNQWLGADIVQLCRE